MSVDVIERLDVRVVRVTPKTCWTFVELRSRGGLLGTGEATLTGREAALVAMAGRLKKHWLGAVIEPALPDRSPRPASLVEAAVVSAVDHAIWDILGKLQTMSVARLLGGVRRQEIVLYANINRRTADRSPAGFAASARAALADGYEAVKIAPFDEVASPSSGKTGSAQALDRGLERIAAVREAIGPDRDLMVDCHWRFGEASAGDMIRAAAAIGVHWIECPLPETHDMIPALKRLRGNANGLGVRLAGCEEGVGLEAFEPFLSAGAYDVLMPDVKYVGGLREMARIAERFAAHGIAFSPHNPSGPVSHAASLQVCASVPVFDRLEIQFDETPLFDALVGGALPDRVNGASRLPNGSAGLGVALDPALLIKHAAATGEAQVA